jgi:O-antigen/teichoic acid export membrane protein
MGQLLVNSTAVTAGGYVAQLVTAVMYLIAARHLPPSKFGPVLGAIGLALVIITVADMGINNWVVRRLATSSDRKASSLLFEDTFGVKLALALALGLVWIGLCFLAVPFGFRFEDVSPLGVLVIASIVAATLLVPLRASERLAVVAFVGIFEKVAALVVSIICFAIFPRSAIPLTMGLASGSVLAALMAGILLPPPYRSLPRFSLSALLALLRSSINFGLASLASQLQRADVAVVNFVAGPVASGLYGAAARLSSLIGVMPTAFSQSMYPFIARSSDRKAAYWSALRTGSLMLVAVSGSLLVCYLYAPLIISVLLGNEYLESAAVLRIYLPGLFLASVNQPLSMLLQVEHDEGFVARVVGAASLVGLSGVALGAAMGGAVGAAIGFILLQVVTSAFLITRVAAQARLSFSHP